MEQIIVKRKPKLELKLKPILVRKRKSGNFYYNPYAGKSSFNLDEIVDDDNYQLIESKNAEVIGVSIQYIKQRDLIAFVFCKLDFSSPYDEVRHWEPFDYAFVDRDKNLYSDTFEWKFNYEKRRWFFGKTSPDENTFPKTSWGSSRTKLHACCQFSQCVIINSSKVLTDDDGKKMWYQYDVLKPFHDMFGEMVPISGNKMVVLDSLNAVGIFLRNKEPKNNKKGKLQGKLDEFLKYELDEFVRPKSIKAIENLSFGWRQRSYNATNENVQKFAIIQKVKNAPEPTCVLRSFFLNPYNEDYKEGGRIYITKKEIISSRVLSDGSFMYQKLLEKPYNWNFSIESFDKSITKGTYLEYFGEIIEDIDYQDRGIAIWSFLKYPITEKLYKMPEMQDIMKIVFKLSIERTPIEVLSDIFGDIDIKETNVYKFLKLNKYQLSRLIEMTKQYFPIKRAIWSCSYYNSFSFCRYFKDLLREENISISDYDNETTDWVIDTFISFIKDESNCNDFIPIDKVLNVFYLSDDEFYKFYGAKYFKMYCSSIYNAVFILKRLANVYSFDSAKKMAPIIKENIQKQAPIAYTDYWGQTNYINRDFIRIYDDFISMVFQSNMQTQVKPYFSTFEELVEMHDTMVDYINTCKDKIEMDKWNSRKSLWDKYKYSDDEYSIIVPEKPSDLAKEGITLHHCVKGYIPRVSNGVTNVVFLRKNDDIDSPFYTIEIDNDNIVQQVHGSCNMNATPEIIAFVDKWIKAKKFKSSNFNKVR